MAPIWWRKREVPEDSEPHDIYQEAEVDEQHALPVGLYFLPEGASEAELVSYSNPLPAFLQAKAPYDTGLIPIPGIGTGAAYTALDAFGTVGAIQMPGAGWVETEFFYDLDNEGLAKEIHFYGVGIAGTADNAAFAPTDIELQNEFLVITIANFKAMNANQIGFETTPYRYVNPRANGSAMATVYYQIKTLGADNIAAANLPFWRLIITPD